MPRTAYVALAATARADPGRLADLTRRLDAEPGWRPSGACGGWRLWTASEGAPAVSRLPHGAGLLVGEAYAHPAMDEPMAAAAPGDSVTVVARRLSRTSWGAYVALLEDRQGPAIYRDPSGHRDGLSWLLGPGLHVVASELRRTPTWLRPTAWALDWTRIGAFLGRPAAATTAPLFEGIEAVGPGDLRVLDGTGPDLAVWSPAEFAQRPVSREMAGPELVRRVDLCTAALVGAHERLLFELSGGLDSSILAGSLGQIGVAGQVAEWLTWTGGRSEADERLYARAVTDRLGVTLTAVEKVPDALTLADLTELGDAVWPAMSGLDAARDRDEVARLWRTGATAILSGQGGDAVFFQMRSAMVLADELRHLGPQALRSPLLAEVARRTRQTVWSVLGEVAAVRRPRPPAEGERSGLLSADLRAATAGVAHAWVTEAERRGVAPGKRLQIQTIANCHVYHGQSRRREVADLLYPLLAQPVVELCLSIPTAVLAGGAHDRLYARQVFANRLPEVVRRRRTKGAFSAYFGRLVAASVPVLKPFLLDGCLAGAGLLDRARMEAALDPDRLILDGRPTELLWAASVEAWVRHWQTRVPDSRAAPRPRAQ